MPTVSIIVPNYNHARFLDERLVSLFNQSYQDFELIFLDDASSDNSIEVFRKYNTRSNIRSILNDRNSGSTFRQWNRGVRAASGRYIWIAESDDVAEPKFLETLVPILERNPKIGIAYCNSTVIDEHGEKKETVDTWSVNVDANRWGQDFINSGTDECRRYLVCRNTIPNASAVIFRKSIYEQCGYANEAMTRCGDWWLWARMLLLSDIAYIAAPLNQFRRHTTVSHDVSKFNIALEEALHILHEIVSNLGLPAEIEPEMTRIFVDNLYWRQHVSNGEPVALPSTILYLAALISQQLYTAVLEFVDRYSNWRIDWLPIDSAALEKTHLLAEGRINVFQNLSAITVKQREELGALKSEREQLLSDVSLLKWEREHLVSDLAVLKWDRNRLLSSRSYRFAQRLQKARGRFVPDDSVQYNCVLMVSRLLQRIRKAGKNAA